MVNSLEPQIDRNVRAEATTEINGKLQADWDVRFDQAGQSALAAKVQELYEKIATTTTDHTMAQYVPNGPQNAVNIFRMTAQEYGQ